ncbi:Mu transposase C-terminal domain-containing protein [Endozoicomonas acroporae]|uniref:Mu transposase C-terminal domain-containing protein n=1 Tax=Endozoicomonas acroporae TaxID=1701104 RepID=UPI000C77539F|nr:Mu transposase C-terminal domain-containing protein [Endozoicomonas acroporae]
MLLNKVFHRKGSEYRFRVIFEAIDHIWLIDLNDEDAWPFMIMQDEFDELIKNGLYFEIDEPFKAIAVPKGSIQEKKRDQAYSELEPVLKEPGRLLHKKERNIVIGQAAKNSKQQRRYIVRQLRRYWQRGMRPNSLVPDYYLSGAGGKPRRNIDKKTGPKRTVSSGEGVIVTEDIAEIFDLAIKGFFIQNQGLSLKAAKTKAVGLYRSRYPQADKTSIPTMRQFRYFYDTNYRKNEVIRQRTPSKIYDKDIRALTSTAAYMNIGPGGRYEIDATIADLYLVSEKDPEKIIGRPVVYVVKDVFSRMVVGLYVGLEAPSWVAAMMAMTNAFLDKVNFCREYGIEIDSSQWPSVGIPASIFADKGELLRRQADVLVNVFDIQLSNSRSYRGDDKGIVERHFNTIQAEFKPYVGGIVEPVNGKKRLGRRYELDAELTLKAFTEMIIHIVINHNNQHVVKGYDFAEDIPEELSAVPVELWNWGIKNRTGRLKPCNADFVKLNLLPSENGTVSEEGIGFKGLNYTCREALSKGWFDRFKQNRPRSVEIAFDPRRTDVVYLRPDDSYDNYWICELSDRSRRYQGVSFVTAAGILKQAKQVGARAKQEEDFQAPDLQEQIEAIAARERSKKPKKPTRKQSERLSDIGKNKVDEREMERSRQAVNLKPKTQRKQTAKVVPLKPAISTSSIDYPSLDDFLEDDDD